MHVICPGESESHEGKQGGSLSREDSALGGKGHQGIGIGWLWVDEGHRLEK